METGLGKIGLCHELLPFTTNTYKPGPRPTRIETRQADAGRRAVPAAARGPGRVGSLRLASDSELRPGRGPGSVSVSPIGPISEPAERRGRRPAGRRGGGRAGGGGGDRARRAERAALAVPL